jgi:hypothetical protein
MTQHHHRAEGALCQSCGAALTSASEFGTDAAGARVAEYCKRCFCAGRFTEPNLTFDELLARRGHGRAAFAAPIDRTHVHVLQALDRWRAPTAPREEASEPSPRERIRKSMR